MSQQDPPMSLASEMLLRDVRQLVKRYGSAVVTGFVLRSSGGTRDWPEDPGVKIVDVKLSYFGDDFDRFTFGPS